LDVVNIHNGAAAGMTFRIMASLLRARHGGMRQPPLRRRSFFEFGADATTKAATADSATGSAAMTTALWAGAWEQAEDQD
jgi:hypothetical protein